MCIDQMSTLSVSFLHLELSAVMPLQSSLETRRDGLCLLSLDAGGARAVSQLKILAELMRRLNFDSKSDTQKRPCDVFDMIAGVGSGGFIAILLVVLGLSIDAALEEFIELSVITLEQQGLEATARTVNLKQNILRMLKKHDIDEGATLLGLRPYPRDCKLVVLIANRHHITSHTTLRTFKSRQGEAINLSVAEAMLATLSTLPLFSPTSISQESEFPEYISGNFFLSNPTVELISEAYDIFGSEWQIACLLSIGCGHLGAFTAPRSPNITKWNQMIENLVTDGEQKAHNVDAQMGHLGLYYRFHVTQGLERNSNSTTLSSGEIISHTAVYLADASVSRKMDTCVDSMKLRDGFASLEQLKHSGGQLVLPPALPPLTRTFIMRRRPWEFAEKALLGVGEVEGCNEQRILVVTGIGGCGKTRLMLKFLRVYSRRFISSFFVDGSSESRIRADIIRHVRSMGSIYSQMTFDECLLFLSQSSLNGPRVILYDNVDDPNVDILSLIPNGDGCTIAITSRNRSMGSISPGAHLELEGMSMPEAVDLLLYTPNQSSSITEQERRDSKAIAEALECLPIALQQARSYMHETRCSASVYLDRLRTSRDRLLARDVKYQREMRYLSTYAAFEASFGKLDRYTQQFLRLLSVLHWSKFPLELIMLAARFNFCDYQDQYTDHGNIYYTGKAILEDLFLQGGTWDATNLDELMVTLQNYSLITLIPGVETLLIEIHPLLHGWVHSCIPEQEKSAYQSAAIVLLAFGSRNEYTPCGQYLPSHVMHLYSAWSTLHANESAAFGAILCSGGLYESALQLQEKVAIDLRQQLSVEDISLSNCLSMLASTYQDFGRLQEALALREEVLTLCKKISGENHTDTITASSNLAVTYRKLGRLSEALFLQEKVLELRKEMLGSLHPDTIMSSSDLAVTYSDLGRLNETLVLDEEALRLRKTILGEHHPDTIMSASNLAVTYSDLGRLDEAMLLQEEMLQLRKEILGERHPDTIMALSNLALTYRKFGRLNEGLIFQKHVLRLRREILGQRHPDTLAASNDLSITYSDLGRLDEALVLQEDVLKLRRSILGDRHPNTIMSLSNLSITYYNLERLDDALVAQEEVLKLRQEVLGAHHPNTIIASSNLALTYASVGLLEEALVLNQKALKQCRKVLGDRHLDTLMASSNLAFTYRKLERLDEALVVQEEVLGQYKEILSQRHPDTCGAMINLAETYILLSRTSDAEDLLNIAEESILEVLGNVHPLYRWCQEVKSSLQTDALL